VPQYSVSVVAAKPGSTHSAISSPASPRRRSSGSRQQPRSYAGTHTHHSDETTLHPPSMPNTRVSPT
jgi:hypothetical protein